MRVLIFEIPEPIIANAVGALSPKHRVARNTVEQRYAVRRLMVEFANGTVVYLPPQQFDFWEIDTGGSISEHQSGPVVTEYAKEHG